MSVGKIIRAVFVACLFFIALYLLGGKFLGPGVGDFSDSIINGYEYHYLGGNEKMIIRKKYGVVVDSRIDGYRVEGDMLFVVRRPRDIYRDGDLTKIRLRDECEYWIINTSTNNIEMRKQKSNKFQELSCQI